MLQGRSQNKTGLTHFFLYELLGGSFVLWGEQVNVWQRISRNGVVPIPDPHAIGHATERGW
eukprot:scaffold324533_cov50-Prasinocladus_malaysianus.AAC.1